MVERPPSPVDRRLAWLTLVVACGIVYASLYPFRFQFFWYPPAGPLGPLLETWRALSGFGDILANVVFYAPFGLFGALALRGMRAGARVAIIGAAGLALSLSMEMLQFYEVQRVSMMSDVYANTVGTLAGAVAAASARRGVQRLPAIRAGRDLFAVLMIAAWLGELLFPYVPVIDLHKYWHAIRPLLAGRPALPGMSCNAVEWIAIACMVESVTNPRFARRALVVLFMAVFAAETLVVNRFLSASELAGAAVGTIAWIAVLSRVRTRAAWVSALFLGVILVRGLEPFHFGGSGRAFGWVPFRSLIAGVPQKAVPSFLYKCFLYGTLIWLPVRAGLRLRAAAAIAGVVVLGVSMAHRYMPGRSSEITDVAMVAILAGALKLIDRHPLRGTSAPAPAVKPDRPDAKLASSR